MTTTTGPRWGPPVEEVPEGACDNGIDGCCEHTPIRTGVQIICGACGAVKPTNGRRAARTPVRFWSRRIPRDDETSWQLELQRPYAWKIYWEMQRCCTGAYMHCTGEQDGGDENEAELNQRYEGGAVGGIRPKGREQSSVPSPEGYAERRKKAIDDESDGMHAARKEGNDAQLAAPSLPQEEQATQSRRKTRRNPPPPPVPVDDCSLSSCLQGRQRRRDETTDCYLLTNRSGCAKQRQYSHTQTAATRAVRFNRRHARELGADALGAREYVRSSRRPAR